VKSVDKDLLEKTIFTLASRGSPLALQQSRWVKAEMERLAPSSRVEILTIRTTGDRMSHQPLPEIGGKGLFTKEVEDALLDGRADLAVHSLKDLPTELPEGLVLAAVPRREDPRDAFLSRTGAPLRDLPQGAAVGTSSVRRAAQLRRLRPDLRIEPLRGNLDTRLRKLREGSLDAIVLAVAGLRRLGLDGQITEVLSEEIICPAVGQGALGIEARAADQRTLEALSALEDSGARLTITAERSLLKGLGGGCQIPIAATVKRLGEKIQLTAIVIRPDGSEFIQATELSASIESCDRRDAIQAAEALGTKAAHTLLEKGAAKILQDASNDLGPFPSPQTP
jgi:hydroxymethylbilane synthase